MTTLSTRMRVLSAVVVIGCLAVVAASQSGTSFALPDALRTHMKDERFQIVTSLRGLPLGVREALQALFGTQTLDIAEPGAEFQGTRPAATAGLPTRRLIAAGCSEDHCLVYYERGGGTPSWHVALFYWRPEANRFEWGGVAPRDLRSIDDVRKAMLAGEIKGPSKVW